MLILFQNGFFHDGLLSTRVSGNNISILESKLNKLNVVFPLAKIGRNWVAEFEDSEGNHIEITAPVDC